LQNIYAYATGDDCSSPVWSLTLTLKPCPNLHSLLPPESTIRLGHIFESS